jgi:hypothetical protein
MQPPDVDRFSKLLLGVSELYGRTLSEAAIGLYWQALSAYAIEVVERAFATYVTHPDSGQYWPKPADILRHLGGGTTQDRAARAWAKVERELRRVGAYASVVFDDPVIMMTLADLSGWPTLCHTALDELPFRAKDFKALYAAYVAQPKAAYPRVLPGLAAHHNAANGLSVAPPVLLGDDPAAAAWVYQTGQEPDALAPPWRVTADLLRQSESERDAAPLLPTRPAPDSATPPVPVAERLAALRAAVMGTPTWRPPPRAAPRPSLPPAEQDRLLAEAGSRSPPEPEPALATEEAAA